MQKKHLLFVIITALFTVSSCSDVYNDYQSVSDLQWKKSDVKSFEFTIDEDANYDMFFALRYASGFPHPILNVHFEIILPDGTEREKDMNFRIVDKDGKYIGDVAGNMWDAEFLFSENEKMNAGKYIVTYTHNMEKDPVIAVIDLGLIVRKTDNKK